MIVPCVEEIIYAMDGKFDKVVQRMTAFPKDSIQFDHDQKEYEFEFLLVSVVSDSILLEVFIPLAIPRFTNVILLVFLRVFHTFSINKASKKGKSSSLQ